MNAKPKAQDVVTVEGQPDVQPDVQPKSDFVSFIERAALDPNIDLDRLKAMIDLHKGVMAQDAEHAYANAMVDAQAEMQPIRANLYNNQTKSKYASYSALDTAIRPIYTKHGFSLQFNELPSDKENHVVIVCTALHRAGHSKEFRRELPADGKGAKGGDVMTKTHASASAMTYGMRYLATMIFNLAVVRDDDGNLADGPEPLSAAQAKEIIKIDHMMDLIAKVPNFRKLTNMRKRIQSLTFLPGKIVVSMMEACNQREDELDRKLADLDKADGADANVPTTKGVMGTSENEDGTAYQQVLDDFAAEMAKYPNSPETQSEIRSEYEPQMEGASDDEWRQFWAIAGRE